MTNAARAYIPGVEVGWAITHSEQGDSHKYRQTPCQDSSMAVTGYMGGIPYFIGIVADGHGSEKHDLSEFGAAAATQAALDCAIGFVRNYYQLRFDEVRKRFDSRLGREIATAWRQRVEEDFRDRNISAQRGAPVDIYTRYGTTLTLTILIRNWLLTGRIGDGEAVIFFPQQPARTEDAGPTQEGAGEPPPKFKGDPIFVFPEIQAQLSNATDSLCSADVTSKWRTQASEITGETYLLICTDGLSDCFESRDKFSKFIGNFLSLIDVHGLSSATVSMPTWFRELSMKGSGDDISIVAAKFSAPSKSNDKDKGTGGDDNQ